MNIRACFLAFTVLFLLILATPVTTRAVWLENGTGICTETDHQLYPEIIRSEDGTYIATWHDKRTGNFNIWAQKFDVDGNALWMPGGILVQDNTVIERYPKLVTDGAGGAIIVWEDYRAGLELYAQRIDADGNKLWGTYGEPVCTHSTDQKNVDMIPDGEGGAFIVWEDFRSSPYYDIYAQRIDGNGATLWTIDGIVICDAAQHQYGPRIATDNAGGAFITWYDYRNGHYDIYVTRIDADSTMWGAGNLAVCTIAGNQYNPEIIYDGYLGAIVTWSDYRGLGYEIYAQKIHLNGYVEWTTNGVAVCTAFNNQEFPMLATDGAGGAIIMWKDLRNSVDWDVFAQRIDPAGALQWTPADGVLICDKVGNQIVSSIISDGMGGAIAVWQDDRVPNSDIYAQRIDASGSMLWADDGAAICTAAYDQEHPVIATDGAAGAIIMWDDWRTGVTDIYAQRIERNGYWGFPAPHISGVRDVPGDEGGYVNLSWDASRLDPWPYMEITSYTVWRAIDSGAAILMLDTGARLLASLSDHPELAETPVIRRELLGAETYYWYLIDTIDPYYLPSYSAPEPTMFDSTATSGELSYFQVIAHTSDPSIFWASEPDSGYSVDNLAPCPPLCLAGEQSYEPEGLSITWAPNEEIDLDFYVIYRGTDPGFSPGTGNLIGSPCDTMLFDGDWRWDTGYCYKVAAIDVHGNESEYALLCSDAITGEETPVTPLATYLEQNYPNPFNPSTRITFGMSEPGHISLRIYDAAGRLVRTLINEEREAGIYSEAWNGPDNDGSAVSSGIYFYNLTAGSFKETKKMVLLR